jgi:cytochrome d ubiquinol oxidase subunit I
MTADAIWQALAAAEPVNGALGRASQDHLVLARQTQALSFIVHIPLVCFGVAFPAMVLFMETLWLRTGDATYKAIAKRWSKVMLILFAVGVVTGTILSFELGLLWPNFMATFGDVFGLAFGLEAFSFFIEAIFVAIYVYGWDRLPSRVHLATGIPVVIAGVTGSLTVISVNAWMNDPQGFDVVAGRVVHARPFDALLNGHVAHELVHMYLAGYLVTAFLVAGVYARRWLRGDRGRYVRAAMVVPLTIGALVAPVQVVVGDWAARTVANDQPLKLAAFEGLTRSRAGAPFTIGGLYEDGEVRHGLQIPKLLSLLAFHDPNARVTGLDSAPPGDRPPVNVVRIAFQTMIAIGTALVALGALYLLTWWRRRRLPRSRWFYRAVMAAGPLALLALVAGWTTTEVGRQPWVVYGYMRTDQAVTNAGGLAVALVVLLAVYALLGVLVAWLLRRLAARPHEVEVAG